MLSAESHRATKQIPDHSFVVDFDAEKGKLPRVDAKTGETQPDQHRVAIKFSKKVQLATIRGYLEGTIDFDNGVLEGISKFVTTPHKAPLTLFRLP